MKNYVIQQGDTFSSLAQQFKLKNESILKTYHNLHCSEEDIMQKPVPGKKILVPEGPQFMDEEIDSQPSASQEESTEEGTHDESASEQPSGETQSSEKTEERQEKKDKDGIFSEAPSKKFTLDEKAKIVAYVANIESPAFYKYKPLNSSSAWRNAGTSLYNITAAHPEVLKIVEKNNYYGLNSLKEVMNSTQFEEEQSTTIQSGE